MSDGDGGGPAASRRTDGEEASPPFVARPDVPTPAGGPEDELISRILDAYDAYREGFLAITRRAPKRFRDRDWRGMQDDATRRLLLYGRRLDALLPELDRALGDRVADPRLWQRAKRGYAFRAGGRPDAELALTFFNSLSRRALDTVGVNPAAEFLGDELPRHPRPPADPDHRWYPLVGGAPAPDPDDPPSVPPEVVRRALEELPLEADLEDASRDARLLAAELERRLAGPGEPDGSPETLELLRVLFYRNKGAYAVGRLHTSSGVHPLVLALLNGPGGARVDAVLTSADEMSVVFGFSRSYFHVYVERPREMVAFLRSLMPRKRVDELYNSLGFDRHGKTELYRALRARLTRSSARFEVAEGEPGLVMSVFTLSGLDVVFKVIKDRFPPQKRVTPGDVKERYRMVYVRDRVGRLADAQEFEHLEIDRDRFEPGLLDRLLEVAPSTVVVEGDQVVLEHLYAVRQMTPLNLYLERADEAGARAAILDYGQAIKDLAAADVFPGDLLLKNFGVSRHGRVIFYDYDELIRLTDCRIRKLPTARRPEDELADEPWYYVGPNDLFPEEFPRFLAIPDGLEATFLEHHGDLFEPDFWREMQERHRAGELAEFFPYPRERRLRPDGGGPAG